MKGGLVFRVLGALAGSHNTAAAVSPPESGAQETNKGQVSPATRRGPLRGAKLPSMSMQFFWSCVTNGMVPGARRPPVVPNDKAAHLEAAEAKRQRRRERNLRLEGRMKGAA